jgi:hypothetical protein
MPKSFGTSLRDICRKLIEIDVRRRLGCSRGESNDIRDHKWFMHINWINLFEQKLPAPYLPREVNPLEIAFKDYRKNEDPLKVSKENHYEKEFIDF